MISIIMQSTLVNYPGAALHRKEKLVRAIESVLNQTFSDWELIVVADNCWETAAIVKQFTDERIKLIFSEIKHTKWSSLCRNIGKDEARGQLILYLDNDDFLSPDYLWLLDEAVAKSEKNVFIVDHYEYDNNQWKQIRARVTMNAAGTANIVHRNTIRSYWPEVATYGSEDWIFIKRIIAESNQQFDHLDVAGYFVAHKRNQYDV